MPDSAFIREVCRQHQAVGHGALALTSANLSGAQSSVEVAQFQELWSSCTAVFDAGRIDVPACGSTIVDLCTPGQAKLVRTGIAHEECRTTLHKFGLHVTEP